MLALGLVCPTEQSLAEELHPNAHMVGVVMVEQHVGSGCLGHDTLRQECSATGHVCAWMVPLPVRQICAHFTD